MNLPSQIYWNNKKLNNNYMRTLENNKGYNQWTRNVKEFWEDRKLERPDLV